MTIRQQAGPGRTQHVRVLRGQMVRVFPSSEELAARKAIVLTQRDVEIITAAHMHGFLTTDLFVLAFFPPPASDRRSPCSAAYQRLKELWLWSYLERVRLPVSPVIGGSRPYLYALGPRGVPVVASRSGNGTTPVQRRRLNRLDDAFVEHDLKATTLWANVKALLRRANLDRWEWIPERDLRARKEWVKDPATNRRLPFLADGAVEFIYPDGTRQFCFVEVDQGTQPLDKFRRKVRSYEEFLAQGLFARRWHRSEFEVLVLTHSSRRLQNLWEVSRREVPESRWDHYLFTTFDTLEPAQFGEERWTTLGEQQVGLLYGQA